MMGWVVPADNVDTCPHRGLTAVMGGPNVDLKTGVRPQRLTFGRSCRLATRFPGAEVGAVWGDFESKVHTRPERGSGRPDNSPVNRGLIGSGRARRAGGYGRPQQGASNGPGAVFRGVVFPLPGGSATVLLRPENQSDGSLKLISSGCAIGGPGYYRIHQIDKDTLRIKYLPLKEVTHVYQDEQQVLRTDHTFMFWGMNFLTLHYKINRKGQ